MYSKIEQAVNEVLGLKELIPNQHVNSVMTNLVETVIQTDSAEVALFDSLSIIKIRSISADAETEMEKFWANRIISSLDPKKALIDFPYLDNYKELAKRELSLVEQSGLKITSEQRILVIGSGPLPLSAYEMHYQSGAVVDHVDSSVIAIDLCRKVSESLGIESLYYTAYGQDVELKEQYDLILIAALAGATKDAKQKIVDNILPKLARNGRIIVRSALGSRELLYPAIRSDDLIRVRLLKEYHPTDHIINSVFVYGK